MENELCTVVELHLEFGGNNKLPPLDIKIAGCNTELVSEPIVVDRNVGDYIEDGIVLSDDNRYAFKISHMGIKLYDTKLSVNNPYQICIRGKLWYDIELRNFIDIIKKLVTYNVREVQCMSFDHVHNHYFYHIWSYMNPLVIMSCSATELPDDVNNNDDAEIVEFLNEEENVHWVKLFETNKSDALEIAMLQALAKIH